MWGHSSTAELVRLQSDEKRISLRDSDRLGNDPQWVPGFLSCRSWMFPERLPNKSELGGSEEILQVLTEHPKNDSVSYWVFLRNFRYSAFDLFRNLGNILLSLFWVNCVPWLTVPGLFRCLSRNCRYFSLTPQSCHDTEEKVLLAVKIELKFFIL